MSSGSVRSGVEALEELLAAVDGEAPDEAGWLALRKCAERARAELRRIGDDSAALHMCLDDKSLGREMYHAKLHKLRFGRIRAAAPRGRATQLADVFASPDLASTLASYDGGGSAEDAMMPYPPFARASRALRAAATRAPPRAMFVFGGLHHRAVHWVERYYPETGTWSPGARMNDARCFPAAAVLRGALYVLGGYDATGQRPREVECFDPAEGAWRSAAPMGSPRSGLAAAVLGHHLYALGGYDGSEHLRSVERFDGKAWAPVADMHSPRDALGAAALGGKLYAVGGVNGGEEGERFDSVECYDPASDSWTEVAPMATPRSGLAVAALRGHLYALGGFSEGQHFSTVERYDPSTNAWTNVAPMLKKRSGLAAAVLGGRLYVVGGSDGNRKFDSAERYDPVADAWHPVASMGEMRQCMAAVGVCARS